VPAPAAPQQAAQLLAGDLAAAAAAGVGQAYLQAVSPLRAGLGSAQQGAAAAAVPISLVESPLARGPAGKAVDVKGRRGSGSGSGGSPGSAADDSWCMTCSDEVGLQALSRCQQAPLLLSQTAAVA
jgi:hypothetical protein